MMGNYGTWENPIIPIHNLWNNIALNYRKTMETLGTMRNMTNMVTGCCWGDHFNGSFFESELYESPIRWRIWSPRFARLCGKACKRPGVAVLKSGLHSGWKNNEILRSTMKSQWICNCLRFNLIICCMYGVGGRNLEKDDAHDMYIQPWSMSARFMELLNKISPFQTSTPQQPLVLTLRAPVTWLIFGSSPWEDLRGTLQDHPSDWSGEEVP